MDWSQLGAIVIGPGGALALALAIIVSLGRGWLVPGFIYAATVERLDKALAGLEATSAAMDRLTDEIRRPRGLG